MFHVLWQICELLRRCQASIKQEGTQEYFCLRLPLPEQFDLLSQLTVLQQRDLAFCVLKFCVLNMALVE